MLNCQFLYITILKILRVSSVFPFPLFPLVILRFALGFVDWKVEGRRGDYCKQRVIVELVVLLNISRLWLSNSIFIICWIVYVNHSTLLNVSCVWIRIQLQYSAYIFYRSLCVCPIQWLELQTGFCLVKMGSGKVQRVPTDSNKRRSRRRLPHHRHKETDII